MVHVDLLDLQIFAINKFINKRHRHVSGKNMTHLVLGVGNSILGDDGVGIYIARELKRRIKFPPNIEIDEIESGGLDLVERVLDYETAIIIDSIITKERPIGTIYRLTADDFEITTRSANVHGLAFPEALARMKEAVPHRVPETIKVFVIEIPKAYRFSETLTPPIQKAAEAVISELIALLKQME